MGEHILSMPEALIPSLEAQKFKNLDSGLVDRLVVVLTVPYIKTPKLIAALFL